MKKQTSCFRFVLACSFLCACPAFANPVEVQLLYEPDDQGATYFINSFGYAIGGAGDVNGDGFDDLIVSSPVGGSREPSFDYRGLIFVYYGGTNGFASQPDWIQHGIATNDFAGQLVGSAGDINGDGFDDAFALAAAYGIEYGNAPTGYVAIYYGSSTGLVPEATILKEEVSDNKWGYYAGGVGDLNNDGYDDFSVSAFDTRMTNWPSGHFSNTYGRVHIFYGSSNGISRAADQVLYGTNVGFAVLGATMKKGGDINGDGFDDLLVGETELLVSQGGFINVFYGSPAGIDPTNMTQIIWPFPPWSEYGFPRALCSAGDVNQDGYDDILTGAWRTGSSVDGYYFLRGVSMVLAGSSNGITTNLIWLKEGEKDFRHDGYQAENVGDVNGDGRPDFFIGARDALNLSGCLYLNGATNLPMSASWTTYVSDTTFHLGHRRVAGVGDINGDGFADMAFGGESIYNDPIIRIVSGSPSGASMRGVNVVNDSLSLNWEVPAGKVFQLQSAGEIGDSWQASGSEETSKFPVASTTIPFGTNQSRIYRLFYTE